MKQKDNRTIEQRAEDLTKVLTWCIIHNIKKTYGNLDEFRRVYERITNGKPKKIKDEDGNITSEQVIFCKRFGFDESIYRKILGGNGSGTHVKLSDVSGFIPNWLHYQPHFNKNFKQSDGSYKTFSVYSYWYIDFTVIERYINDADVADCRSKFYTKRQFDLINKVFLKNSGKDNIMTKEEQEQYQKDYEAGLKAFPLEVILKDEAKKKKSLRKLRKTLKKKKTDSEHGWITVLPKDKTFDFDDPKDVEYYDNLAPWIKEELEKQAYAELEKFRLGL